MTDPTRRFSDRAADYDQARPSYPLEVVDRLRASWGLVPDWVVADVGSGTGILSRLFLDAGNRVCGVEPNRAMREQAERSLGDHAGFRSVAGRAERTGLEAASVDLVVVGQAFHWFEPPRARTEFLRILRRDGPVMLVWNDRAEDAGPFMGGYERLLRRFGTDYDRVRRAWPSADAIAGFFGRPDMERHDLAHAQLLDRDGLRARVRSSSYVPAPGEPGHAELMEGVDRLFDRYERAGRVQVDYATRMYVGHLERGRKRTGKVG